MCLTFGLYGMRQQAAWTAEGQSGLSKKGGAVWLFTGL